MPETSEPEGGGRRRDTGHYAAQLRLAKIAKKGGLDVWIARNDRNTVVDGERLGDFSEDALPKGVPADVRRTIELIDVVWIRRNLYIAAFEIETTTPVFTGLQRMADLIAAAPNFRISLYVIAGESRREKVFSELTRPLFRYGLEPPLEEVCRYISLEALQGPTRTTARAQASTRSGWWTKSARPHSSRRFAGASTPGSTSRPLPIRISIEKPPP